MPFFRNNAVASINLCFEEIRTQLLAQGWTEIILQTATSVPAANYMGRESIFVAPGLAAGSGNAAAHIIGMAVMTSWADLPGLQFYTATGYKQMAITSVAVTGTSAVFTAAGHPFVVGDLVLCNGTSNALINQTCGGTGTAPALVTAATANTWTQALPVTSGSINGTGGTAVSVYNFTGVRSYTAAGAIGHIPITDAAHRLYGFVDKFRLVAVAEQSAVFRFQFVGPSGRDHIQGKASDVAKLVTQVVSNGVAASTLDLDRACANLYAGQTISVIPPDRANPGMGGTVAQAGINNSTVVTKPTSTQLTAVLPAGTYPAGSIIGKDPVPLCLCGNGVASAQNLNIKTWYFSHALAGTRTNPLAHTYTLDTQDDLGGLLNVDPDAAGFWQEQRLVLYSTEGRRGPLPGVAAFPVGVASNLDIMRTEDAASAPSGDFLCLASQLVAECMVCIGPGAA